MGDAMRAHRSSAVKGFNRDIFRWDLNILCRKQAIRETGLRGSKFFLET
jgi:hypothetical protein